MKSQNIKYFISALLFFPINAFEIHPCKWKNNSFLHRLNLTLGGRKIVGDPEVTDTLCLGVRSPHKLAILLIRVSQFGLY
jgi:hypothetical protein